MWSLRRITYRPEKVHIVLTVVSSLAYLKGAGAVDTRGHAIPMSVKVRESIVPRSPYVDACEGHDSWLRMSSTATQARSC